MPPWAAPVWDRVGESLVRTAVRTRVEDSSAARMPAPPAPTMTTSYWCVCMVFRTFPVSLRLALRQRRGGVDARVEREDDEGAEHEGEHGAEGQQRLQDEPGGVPLAVVVDDRADAVDAVELGEPEHHQVPGLPERAGPLAGDEGEVDRLDALSEHEVDEEVAEDQDEQHHAGAAHEQPRPQLEVAAGPGGALVRRARRQLGDGAAAVRGRGRYGSRHLQTPQAKTLIRCRMANGTNRITNRPTTAHPIWRCRRVPRDQKSTRMSRMPLKAWKMTAATRPSSPRPTIGVL